MEELKQQIAETEAKLNIHYREGSYEALILKNQLVIMKSILETNKIIGKACFGTG